MVDLVTWWYLQGPLCSFLVGALFTKRLLEPLPHLGTAQALPAVQQCDDTNLVGCWLRSAVLARRAVQEYIITSIKEVLRIHFNRAVELKVGPCSGESDTGAQVKAHYSGRGTCSVLSSLPSPALPTHPSNGLILAQLEGCIGRVGTEGL